MVRCVHVNEIPPRNRLLSAGRCPDLSIRFPCNPVIARLVKPFTHRSAGCPRGRNSTGGRPARGCGRPGASGPPRITRIGVVLPPLVRDDPLTRAVRVLPRVDVDGSPVGVRRESARMPIDPTAVERGRVVGIHRPIVVRSPDTFRPSEPVDRVHRPDREATAVEAGQAGDHSSRDRLRNDQLTAMRVSVEAPVADADDPQPGSADRTALMPAAADHLPPQRMPDSRHHGMRAPSMARGCGGSVTRGFGAAAGSRTGRWEGTLSR